MRDLRATTSVLLLSLSACGRQLVEFGHDRSDGGGADAPTVTATYPLNGAAAVALDVAVSATFSARMDPTTLDPTTFAVLDGATPVTGAVVLDTSAHTAIFTPSAALSSDRTYTATLSTRIRDVAHESLAVDYIFGFTTGRFGVVESAAVGEAVPVPDYTLSVAGLELLTDANDVVQSATGTAVLTAGSVTGQAYALSMAVELSAYSVIEAEYAVLPHQALVERSPATHPATLALPAVDFLLDQADLTTPRVRTLIVSNSRSGVRSYQLFAITFNAAPRLRY
jgi:Big-like domain-containing protein